MTHESYLTDAMLRAIRRCPVVAGSVKCPPLGTMRALERRGYVKFDKSYRPSAWVLTAKGRRVYEKAE
jgi:hypothetical protein